jgi:cellulose synthase/poly-beta-1,6-N-acetylglucosamine synthase-like glycosyltransferase
MGNENIKVSVLVAARNEAENIASCLESLVNQQFPAEQLEILVGNDDSEDETADIVSGMRIKYPNIILHMITEKKSGLLGKANVLAQLASKATGELLLVTDADVQVNPVWVSSMVKCFSPGVALVSGVVALQTNSLFSRLQNADWLFYMGKCAQKSDEGKPVTAIGCNMAIRSEVYKQVGGYEGIPFSITEDYELFRVVSAAGFKCKSFLAKELLAITKPVRTFPALLKQRKRWLTGSFSKSWRFMLSYNLNGLYFPFLIASGITIHFLVPVLLFSIKWLSQVSFLNRTFKKLELPVSPSVGLYPFYIIVCNFIFLFFQFQPSLVTWKGRPYD